MAADQIQVGARFGKLVVLQKGPLQYGKHGSWLCRCDCGTERPYRAAHLKAGLSQSCGCSRKSHMREMGLSRRKAGNTQTVNSRLSAYRVAARRRGLRFDLSRDEFVLLTSQRCAYCGAPPSNIERSRSRPSDMSLAFIYNGLDRMDNDQGYHVHNVVPCCHSCNIAKLDRTSGEFIAHARRVAGVASRVSSEFGQSVGRLMSVGWSGPEAARIASDQVSNSPKR